MKTLNEEIKKMKHLFNYKKGDVITESFLNEQNGNGEPAGGGVKEMDIYWRSCDGGENKLSDESKNLLKPVSGKENVYYFEELPEDKNADGSYDIQGCLGVYSVGPLESEDGIVIKDEDDVDKFTIDEYGFLTSCEFGGC